MTQTISDDESDLKLEFDTETGTHLGVGFELPLTSTLYVTPGILLNTRGFANEIVDTSNMTSFKLRSRALYLDIPVLFGARFPLGGETALAIQGGPYLGLGLYGQQKLEITPSSDSSSEPFENRLDIEWGNDNVMDNYRRLNYGLMGSVSFEYRRLLFGATYDYSLTSAAPDPSKSYVRIRFKNWRFSLGYRFVRL